MSDDPLGLPPPEPQPQPQPEPPRPRRQQNLVPWIYVLGFVVLAFALIWIWQNPNPSPEALRPSQIASLVNEVTSLTVRIEKLEARESAPAPDLKPLQDEIGALTQRVNNLPKPATPDLQPIQQQLNSLKAQLASTPHAIAPDLTPLEQHIAALQQQVQSLLPPPDLQPIQAQLASLEKQVAGLSQLPAQLQTAAAQRAALGQRLDSLASTQQDLGRRLDDLATAVKSQTATFDQKVAAVQQQAEQVSAAAKSAAWLARLEAARSALTAGQKLGPIEGAPPALARFADTPPPTEADLRLSFPKAAKEALAASQQQTSGATFGQRVLNRAQNLLTVREGDRVLVGDPAAGLLASAQTRLDAGDLRGAAAEVSKLTGPAAQAIAPWLDKARALLAAQDALNTMAAHV